MSNKNAGLPTFVPSISDDIRAAIEVELKQIETDHNVKIIFAVESGSRAWGFPSPDSDYDVRFVYAHQLDWYLSIEPGRDVIERPISDELDIGGWDIKKALGLLLKPNPVMFEWLSSPIRYSWMEAECDELIAFSKKPVHSTACLYHYLNLGQRQFNLHMGNGKKIRLKTYFYVLRPALAIRWMRLRPNEIPPMNIQALIQGLDIPPSTVDIIGDLIERKAKLNETEDFDRILELDQLIQAEFDWAKDTEKEKSKNIIYQMIANRLFRDIVRSFDE